MSCPYAGGDTQQARHVPLFFCGGPFIEGGMFYAIAIFVPSWLSIKEKPYLNWHDSCIGLLVAQALGYIGEFGMEVAHLLIVTNHFKMADNSLTFFN